MDKEQAIILARKYKEAVAEKLPLKALYLYGSYSKGTYTEDSDIDIAVVVDYLSDNYFEDTPLLWKLRRKVSNLITRIHKENPDAAILMVTHCRIFPAITRLITLEKGVIVPNAEEYHCHSCFGIANEDGYYEL